MSDSASVLEEIASSVQKELDTLSRAERAVVLSQLKQPIHSGSLKEVRGLIAALPPKR